MRRFTKQSTAGSTNGTTVPSRAPRHLVVIAALALTALLLVAATASAAETEPPEYLKSFGPDGTDTSSFQLSGPVAVDQTSHAVYVFDVYKGAVYKFDEDGNPLSFGGSAGNLNENELSGLTYNQIFGIIQRNQIAVNSSSHVFYVTDKEGAAVSAYREDGEPVEFTAGPEAGTNRLTGTNVSGVATDADGNIYVSEHLGGVFGGEGQVKVYSSTGELITSASVEQPDNLAVAPNGTLYVASKQFDAEGFGTAEEVREFKPSEFPVTASTTYLAAPTPLNNNGVIVTVDPANGDVYVAEGSNPPYTAARIIQYDQTGTPLSTFGGYASGIAIIGDNKRVFLTVAHSGQAQVDLFAQKPIVVGEPSIVSASVSNVSADAATLLGEINPNTLETTYRFEYGLEDCAVSVCASVPVGGAAIAAGHKPVAVQEDIFGLSAGTTYHYRVVAENAENAEGPTEGPDRTFTTQVSGLGFQLADARAWEMVSPPNKHAGLLIGATNGLIQAAADGNGLAYLSKGSVESNPDGSRLPESTSILARRSGAGWRSRDIAAPSAEAAPLANGDLGEYKLMSPDLSRALLNPRSSTPLSVEASERAPYLRENSDPALYTPLVTGKEGYANVPPGTEFGGEEHAATGGVTPMGASADLSKVVIRSNVPLAAGVGAAALYEWSAGQLQPLSVLPPAEGSGVIAADIGAGVKSTRHAVSEDGSRVFWTSSNNKLLYVRDTDLGESARLDVPHGGSGVGSPEPVFQGASSDGTIVYFADQQQLTEDASPEGRDLYRCEIPPGATPPACSSLIDVSAPPASSTESAALQGIVAGLSADGASVYFVAKGILDPTLNQQGEGAVAGQPNLYLWKQGEGVRFVATLSKGDRLDWAEALSDFYLSTAISPSGRYLSFMSERNLTAYDNRDRLSDDAVQEVLRYDAVTGHLDCVSCDPTGARPGGIDPVAGSPLVDPRRIFSTPGSHLVAATLPQPTIGTTVGPMFHQPRAALDNGRIYFNAYDALVPADSNGQWDVYQYEPTGVGDCTASSGAASISRSAGGCVSLISSGTAEEEAGFLDASETGDDVFFLTSAQLNEPDEDHQLDVYDARVNGVPATLPSISECLGEACQPAVQPPNDPTPASASFRGAGNPKPSSPKPCAKGQRKVRHHGRPRCVAKNRKRHPRAHHNRRAHR